MFYEIPDQAAGVKSIWGCNKITMKEVLSNIAAPSVGTRNVEEKQRRRENKGDSKFTTIWNGDYPWIVGGVDHRISEPKNSYANAVTSPVTIEGNLTKQVKSQVVQHQKGLKYEIGELKSKLEKMEKDMKVDKEVYRQQELKLKTVEDKI